MGYFQHNFEFSFLDFGFDPHAVVRVRDTVDCAVLLPRVPPDVLGCTVLRASLGKICTVLHANSTNMHRFACGLKKRASFGVQPSKRAARFCVQTLDMCTVLHAV